MRDVQAFDYAAGPLPSTPRRKTGRYVVAWACLLTLAFAYGRTLRLERGPFVKHPIRYAQSILAATLELADDDPPGRRLLEAEAAQASGGTWQMIESPPYSGGRAFYTGTQGARLEWRTSLAPGDYELTLLVYAYPKKVENSLRITVGDTCEEFSWRGSRPERRVALTRNITLSRAATGIALEAGEIRQPYLLVDCVCLMPKDAERALASQRLWLYAKVIAAVAFVFACSLCWGVRLVHGMLGRVTDPFAHLVVAQGLGLVLMATLTMLLGIVGWFHRPVVLTMLLLGPLVAGSRTYSDIGLLCRETRLFRHLGFTLVAMILLGIMIFASCGALAPAVGVDSLLYHLPIAKWLLIEGRFSDHPYQLAWGFSHLVSNLFALSLATFNDPSFRPAVLTHACLGMLWIASIYAAGKALWGRAGGLAAAAICLAFEGVTYCFTLALVDLGFAAFAGCAILTFIIALREWHGPLRGSYLFAASVLAGAASVCKLNGPTIAIALAISAAFQCGLHRQWRSAAKVFVLVGVVSLATASPMYVKNYLVYGNPLHPFSCGFVSRGMENLNAWALFGNSDWPAYVGRVGWHAVYRWPFDWLSRKGFDWLCPGPAFAAGLLLFLVSSREWVRRHAALLVYALVLMAFWFAISPLARFGWPWLSLLTILSCAPLAERPIRWQRFLIPVVPLLLAGIPLFAELERPLRMMNMVTGASSESAYHRAMAVHHAGENMGPPADGIAALNRQYHEAQFTGRVLIDTNLVAYADFPTVPAWYYLIVETLYNRVWWKAPGYPFLSMAGKAGSDEQVRAELERLNVSKILMKKNTPTPAPNAAGRYPYCHDGATAYAAEDRFDAFIERWVREGRATRTEYADSILYSLRAP